MHQPSSILKQLNSLSRVHERNTPFTRSSWLDELAIC